MTEQKIEEFRQKVCSIYSVPYSYLWRDKGGYMVENSKDQFILEKAEHDSMAYNTVYSQTFSLKEIVEKYIDNPDDKEYFYKLYELLIKKANRDGIIYGYELKTMENIMEDN